jgi:hypothetical protein
MRKMTVIVTSDEKNIKMMNGKRFYKFELQFNINISE